MQKKILIAEHHRNIREIITFMLKNRGYDIIETDNGADVIMYVTEQKPDLIIIDAMIPAKPAFDICSQLKENKTSKIIPLVILTTGSEKENQYWLEKCKADALIQKPFRARDIIQKIEMLLKINPVR